MTKIKQSRKSRQLAGAPGHIPTSQSTPNSDGVKEIAIKPAQATHFAELAANADQARQEAKRIMQIASQPLIATAESLLRGEGLDTNRINVLGLGGTPDKPTLRYIEKPA